jgi:hypothetical protein
LRHWQVPHDGRRDFARDGGYGFTAEFPVSRFYRGARYGTLGGGTTETLRDLIGKRVLAGVDPVDGIFGLGAF